MPFAIIQISVANLDLNSTNTMEGRCHTTKIFRFRGTTFKTLTNPGSYPANLLSQTLEQPKVDCENSEVQRCKPKNILNKITISFFNLFNIAPLHPSNFHNLLWLFWVYWLWKFTRFALPVAPSKQCAYHVTRLLNFAIGRPTLSGGGAGEGARAVAQRLQTSNWRIHELAALRPSKSHLRPSKVAPTPIPLSGGHDDPFRTLAAYRVNSQRAKRGWRLRGRKNSHNLALYGTRLAKTRGWLVWRFTCTGIKHHHTHSFQPKAKP